jgi:uncharacterized membrane protein YbhN (UPF0104 family)
VTLPDGLPDRLAARGRQCARLAAVAGAPATGATDPPAAAIPAPARRRRWLGPARWLLFAAVLAAVAYSIASQWGAVRHDIGRVAPGWLVLAAIASLLSVAAPVQTWRSSLRAIGGSLPLEPAASVFFVGQLGKYLPGSVWPLLAQMELGQRYGLARQQVAVAGALPLVLSVIVTGALGLLVLPLAGSLPVWEVALLLAFVVVGATLLWPRILDAVMARLLRLLRRPPLPAAVRGDGVAASVGWSVVAAAGLVLQADLIARGLGADATGTALAGGALLVGITLGIVVVPVPAGAGIREAAIVLLLHGHLGTAEATALALLSRLLLALADLTIAGVGWLLGRRVARAGTLTGGAPHGPG